MANDIQIQKTVFNAIEFNKVVDSTFNTFKQPVPQKNYLGYTKNYTIQLMLQVR